MFGKVRVSLLALAFSVAALVWAPGAQASPAPVEDRLAWTDNGDIFTSRPDGTDIRDLATRGLSPTWSPTGTHIAFESSRDGGFDIYVMDANGSNVHVVSRVENDGFWDRDPTWSPDGSQLAFYTQGLGDDQTKIFVVDVDGSDLHSISLDPAIHDFSPDWSPDGSKIAFIGWTNAGGSYIYTMNADGTGRSAAMGPRGSWHPAWSSDGTKVAAENDGLGVLDVATQTWTQVWTGTAAGPPTFSPDGTTLVFSWYVIAPVKLAMVSVATGLLTVYPSAPANPTQIGWWHPKYPDAVCTIIGTEERDRLTGTPGDDVICGLGGNDVLAAGAGNDTVRGGDGDDKIIGSSGNDILDGGSGGDTLRAGGGKDAIVGGTGNDILAGDSGTDELHGSDGIAGNDILFGGFGGENGIPDTCNADLGDTITC